MAIRKRGAALFDVIHHDSRFPARHSGGGGGGFSIGRPSSWFGRKNRDASFSEMAAFAPEPMEPAAASGPPLTERLAALIPPLPRFRMSLDGERGTVRFQLSYTATVVAIAGVFLLVAMGYVVGRHGARRALPALAEQTTDELRAGPASPEVLDVGPDSQVAMATTTTPTSATPTSASPAPAATTVVPRPTAPAAAASRQTAGATATAVTASNALRGSFTEPKQTAPVVRVTGKRTVGAHYVIMQTYPEQERQLAEDAVKLLSSNGVPCTIETGIPFAPKWLAVVGCTEFDRVKNSPQYDQYIALIQQIGSKATMSHFKQFQPQPYKWKEPKGDSGKPE